uniref:PEST proteolytic signal-containing nuclear protein n=1 Tax=Panagrellus redivivus TaxID=6233 RepID=A0A7E4V796_PANRE
MIELIEASFSASATADVQPPTQLPVEHASQANPNGMMPNATSATNPQVEAVKEEESRKRKGFYSPPTLINQSLLAAAAEAAASSASETLPPATAKRVKYGFLSAPQNNGIH